MQYGGRPLHQPDRVFFIGDIHGHALNLKKLLDKILPEFGPRDHLVFLGDLVNGAPNSAKVLEMITELRNKFPGQVFNLMGNHEWMLLAYCHNYNDAGMKQFGVETLASFQKAWDIETINADSVREALEDRGIWEWLSQSLPYYETEKLLATHAPLTFAELSNRGLHEYEPGVPYLLDRKVDTLWNFVNEDDDVLDDYIEKVRICGHQYGEGTHPRIFEKRVFVDTGCGKAKDGPLSCVVYPGFKIIQSD